MKNNLTYDSFIAVDKTEKTQTSNLLKIDCVKEYEKDKVFDTLVSKIQEFFPSLTGQILIGKDAYKHTLVYFVNDRMVKGYIVNIDYKTGKVSKDFPLTRKAWNFKFKYFQDVSQKLIENYESIKDGLTLLATLSEVK